jgi:hypothetical protein
MRPCKPLLSSFADWKEWLVAVGAVLLLLALPGCGGGSGGSAVPAKVQQPITFASSLTLKQGSSFDIIQLDWVRPIATYDGFLLEASVAGSPFQSLTNDILPANWESIILTFDPSTPELLDLQFRLCAVRGGIRNEYTNVVPYFRGLRPASQVTTTLLRGGLFISWAKASLAADAVRVDKALLNPDGSFSGWLPLAQLGADALSFMDQDLLEGTTCSYRVTYAKGSVSSAPALATAPPIPVSSVTAFSAVAQTDGIHLGWKNRSSLATEIVVWRSPGSGNGYASSFVTDIAHLPPNATTFVDAVSTPGTYEYYLETKSATASIWSLITHAQYQVPNAPVVSTQVLTLPTATWLFRSGHGATCLSLDDKASPGVRIFNGSTWDAHPALGALWLYPYVRFDASDHPHFVSLKPVGGVWVEFDLIHEWHDGTQWQSEPILTRKVFTGSAFASSGNAFELDSSGQIHLLLDESQDQRPSTASLVYLHKDSSGWVEESLNVLPAQPYNRVTLAVDPSNAPHAVVWGSDGNGTELSRGPGGTWTASPIPTIQLSSGAFSKLVFPAPDHALLVFDRIAPSGPPLPDVDLMCIEKVAGTWQSPYRLGAASVFGLRYDGDIALSTDRSRIALLANASTDRLLYLFSKGTWMPLALTPRFIGYERNPALVFDDTGRVTVFGRDSLATGATATYTILKETP